MSSDLEEKISASEDVNIPEPTNEDSKQIQAINKETVHRICSGQVVLSLAVAVKELVENSIDAKATVIEVKLKEHGLEYVEVTDNGYGVEENNLEAMTAKYHTSKIKEFSDLSEVATFGFRGEALSSLCALSEMKIITKHKSAAVGVLVELDHEGKIKNKSICPREIGTTVTLSNLFATLPVRKREFQKNIKKEFTKMCQILQAYCLISTGIKIICSNITEKGKKTIFLSTQGSISIFDNIIAIFGSKQTSDLIAIKPPLLDGEKFNEESFTELEDVSNSSLQVKNEDIEKLNNIDFNIEGWISSCSHGSGRSSKDRQYFFINSRPCDNKNLSKLVNEMYHRYNVNQFPFVFLNLIMKRSDVDVNVTPDKRQLLLNNEKILLLAIKRSLTNTFGNIPSIFKTQNSTLLDFKINENCKREKNDDESLLTQTPSSQNFLAKLSQWKHTGSTEGISKPLTSKRKTVDEIEQRKKKLRKIQDFLSQQPIFPDINQPFVSYSSDDNDDSSDEKSKANSSDKNLSVNLNALREESEEYEKLLNNTKKISLHKENFNELYNKNDVDSKLNDLNSSGEEIICQINFRNIENEKSEVYIKNDIDGKLNDLNSYDEEIACQINCKNIENEKSEVPLRMEMGCESDSEILIPTSQSSVKSSQDSVVLLKNKTVTIELDETDSEEIKINKVPKNIIETSIEEIRKLAITEDECLHYSKPNLSRLKFKSEINPNKNKSAEEELDKEITKDMFAKMEIIGQFNLGFIIVKLDDDLFIIDQHATDEKYNFEDLQKTVVLQSQTLTIPERLELTAVDEMILIDNKNVFEANGFKIHVDHDAPPTKKLKLLSKPYSKNWQFGKEDISDLLFMLQDAPPDTMVRPSKVRAMFASRACRKSIMIGQTLNKTTMRRLVNHMGEIEHPWNCPHGRPTMRHLINLTMIESDE